MRKLASFLILLLMLSISVKAQDDPNPVSEVVRTQVALGDQLVYQAQVSAIPVSEDDGVGHFNDCLDIVGNGEIVASECFAPTARVKLTWIGTRPNAEYIHAIYFARGNQTLSGPDTSSLGGFFSGLGKTARDIWNNPAEYASPALDQLCYFNERSLDLTCEDYRNIRLPFPPDQN